MDVTFVCSSGEAPFKMEVGFFDTVQDIKQKLQGRKGWPAAAMSLSHNGDLLLADDGAIERHGVVEGSVIRVALLDADGQRQRKKRTRPSSKKKGREYREEPPLRVAVVSRCGAGRVEVEVAVGARGAPVGATLRGALAAAAGFPLPRDGAYFFIHRQGVMDESRSFEWHGVAAGDEVVVFDGSVTRGGGPAYWFGCGSRGRETEPTNLHLNSS